MNYLDNKAFFENDYIYDLETYPNLFSFCFVDSKGESGQVFEISTRKDNRKAMFDFLNMLVDSESRLIGFNNLGFDYPLLHFILNKPTCTAKDIYNEAQKIIKSFSENKFGKSISVKNHYVKQVDLYKINHFDNPAKATSLKILKFNMKLDNLMDLPYKVGSTLTEEQMDNVIRYNIDDVLATLAFYYENHGAMELRNKLSDKYNIDFTNMSDAKIGSEIFVQEIEKVQPKSCFKYVGKKKEPRQTKRRQIYLAEVLLPYIQFKRPEFQAIYDWIQQQVITETNGVFTNLLESDLGDVAKYCDLVTKKSKKMTHVPSESEIKAFKDEYPMGWVENTTAEQKYSKKDNRPLKTPVPSYFFCWKVAENLHVNINNHKYIFGTGGLHSSIDPKVVHSDHEYLIADWDVSSYYPNLSIVNNIYPAHLGLQFCKTYQSLYEERKKSPKGSADNLSIKLALNATYGNSNNQFSPFFDSQYTMAITLNGQLSLCMLIEDILELEGSSSVQSNTDGITMLIKREHSTKADELVKKWEETTLLEMERNDYKKMYIRDVNNYVAVYENGKYKMKGAYVYELEHHKDNSSIVIQKAVAEYLTKNIPIEEFIKNHKDKYDFMLRTKIPKSFTLVSTDSEGVDTVEQNVSRYYVSSNPSAKQLFKLMPALEGKEDERRNGICVGKKVRICNNIFDFEWDIDYDYYIQEANKLVEIFKENKNG